MGKNNKRKDELKALIKRFEEQTQNNSFGFYSTEEFETIIHHFEEQGKYKKALRACSAGIEQYPFSTELLYEKAQILSNLEQYDESVEILARLNTLQPNDPEILLLNASVLALKGDFEAAIEMYLYAEPFVHEKDDLYYPLLAGLLCNDAELQGEEKIVGDPTEAALLVSALKAGLSGEGFQRMAEVPFNSERKRMSVLVKGKGRFWVFSKGSVESILEICDF